MFLFVKKLFSFSVRVNRCIFFLPVWIWIAGKSGGFHGVLSPIVGLNGLPLLLFSPPTLLILLPHVHPLLHVIHLVIIAPSVLVEDVRVEVLHAPLVDLHLGFRLWAGLGITGKTSSGPAYLGGQLFTSGLINFVRTFLEINLCLSYLWECLHRDIFVDEDKVVRFFFYRRLNPFNIREKVQICQE